MVLTKLLRKPFRVMQRAPISSKMERSLYKWRRLISCCALACCCLQIFLFWMGPSRFVANGLLILSDVSSLPGSVWQNQTTECLSHAGIFTVTTRHVTLLRPKPRLDQEIAADSHRKHLPTHLGRHGDQYNTPLLVAPLPRNVSRLSNYDPIAGARTYFAGRRGRVVQTDAPETYYCRAIASEALLVSDYNITKLEFESLTYLNHQPYFIIFHTTDARKSYPALHSHAYLCEEITMEDVRSVGFASCSLVSGTAPSIQALKPGQSWIVRWAFACLAAMASENTVHQIVARREMLLVYSFFLIRNLLCWLYVSMPLFVFCLSVCSYRLLLLSLCFRVVPDDKSMNHLSSNTRRWLVTASHRLDSYLEDLMSANIITQEQFIKVYDRQRLKGKHYGLRLLRHIIVKNNAIDRLREFLLSVGAEVDFDHDSHTSASSGSDNEILPSVREVNSLSEAFFDDNPPGMSVEAIVEANLISGRDFVQVVDTRQAEGNHAATTKLVRKLTSAKVTHSQISAHNYAVAKLWITAPLRLMDWMSQFEG